MWQEMIERYSEPGDTILDPLAGIGTSLIAALMGRNVICVELEAHFVDPMRRSWEKMRNIPMLGHEMGQAIILRGDARALPLPDASVGAAITSPPYSDQEPMDDTEWFRRHRKEFGGGAATGHYTRPVDAILTSPPYEEALAHGGGGANADKGLSDGYTRKPVDAILTSPPYEGSQTNEDAKTLQPLETAVGTFRGRGFNSQGVSTRLIATNGENIGNLRGGDLYALLVYNRLRREPNLPVEVYLCGKCLPVEIAESLQALTIPDAIVVPLSGTPITTQGSKPTSPGASGTISAIAEQKLPTNLSDVASVPERTTATFSGGDQSQPSGEPRSEPLITTSQTQGTTQPIMSTGKAGLPRGGGLLGVSSDGRCLNVTTISVPDADKEAWLSIISKVQKKLAENGITASETWLQSAAPVTPADTQSHGCLLCNASLAVNLSKPEVPMLNTALLLRFVTPNIVPLHTTAGGQSNYWVSITQVYEECFRVLKPGGLLCLVLKGFTRAGVYVDLPGQTEALLLEAGWVKHDHWRRELWSLSFWRILQKRRDPAAFDDRLNFEEVLAFRKPASIEVAGSGIDTVITSPPYEEAQSGGGIAIKGHFNDPGLAQRVYSARAMNTRR